MPRKRYNPRTKAAILEAAREARASGKTWEQAFEAAKEKGYTGSTPALVKMVNYSGGRKPGRPRGRKRGRKPGRKPFALTRTSTGLNSIEAMVDNLVKQRISAVLDKAIAVLQAAKR
jgi:hypothetical protein